MALEANGMSRKMSKRDFLKEFGYTERAKHIKDATQLVMIVIIWTVLKSEVL